jgi:hypothetical protein
LSAHYSPSYPFSRAGCCQPSSLPGEDLIHPPVL